MEMRAHRFDSLILIKVVLYYFIDGIMEIVRLVLISYLMRVEMAR